MENFEKILQDKVVEIEEKIKTFLPKEAGYQKTVMEAMNYSMLAGGKRLRPMLMLETYRLFGGKGDVIYPFMAAIEMIHTYSLVHDDLPAMDNDEYRRGRKTTHVVYGEAMGILAGDALLNYAFETMLQAFVLPEVVNADVQGILSVTKAMQIMAKKAGIYGMIGGQTADIEAENANDVSMETLMFIHKNKTAALIEAAMTMGAVLAGASEEEVKLVEKSAYNIGIAFQIQDDILDVVGDGAELGKPIGSDEKNGKTTYVTLKGLEESAVQVEELSKEAMAMLQGFGGDSEFLLELVTSLIHRRK